MYGTHVQPSSTQVARLTPWADKLHSPTTMAADAPATTAAATEHSVETSLAELLNQETGQTGAYELKVIRAEMVEYEYSWQGKKITTKNVQVILQSHKPEEYCLGVAKLQKKDGEELKKILGRFKVNTTWKFTKVKLLDEKSAFINTACRITVDLRKTTAMALLQSASFPKTPTPTTSIADILGLRQMQRFDLMAIPAAIIAERRSGTGQNIADVRLIDGSKDPRDKTAEPANATMPLTLFFKGNDDFETFKQHVGRTPLLFMCLSGIVGSDSSVKVSTLKDQSWWETASGTKCDAMTAQADVLCNASAPRADVAQLATFQPTEATDYTNVPATLTACSLLTTNGKHEAILGDATEQLYQLNNVYVPIPTSTDSICTGPNDHLWTLLDCWDYSKKITIAFRSSAMLQLAQIPKGEHQMYKDQHAAGELRHPVLSSVRVRIKKKGDGQSTIQSDATEHSQPSDNTILSAMAVEAEPCNWTEIPNDSVDAIHGLLAAGPSATSERLAATTLQKLKPSPFYNMLADGEPSDKALVLLKFTQRSNGKQILNGFRIVTDLVEDACDASAQERYGTIACCTPEKSTDFTAARNSLALAVICKVMNPSKEQHAADLYIETMEPIASEHKDQVIAMVTQLQRVSTVNHGNAATSTEAAWQQRKCRCLQRYPTQA
jgi:hypothetical protein